MSEQEAGGASGLRDRLTPAQKEKLLQDVLRKRAASTAGERIPRRSPGGPPPPLSFAQQRLWLVDRLEPGSPAYNIPYALRLRGALDVDALRRSLDALVERHETLRTTLEERGGAPVQVIHPPSPAVLVVVEVADEEEASRLAGEEAARPFDLAAGPLLRCTLLRLAANDHVFCFTMHHVVSDAWSMDLVVREFSAFYGAFSQGGEVSLPELPVQYADYAAWQRAWLAGAALEEQVGWWRECLAGAPPLLEVPVDRPRAPGQSAAAGIHPFALSPELSAGLRTLARQEGATLFMTVLAGWQALLGRWSGQDDVVVGSPVAGRTRRELEGVIGFFVNMLVLRAELGGGATWRELLGRVREGALGAYAHQDLPFERLVEEVAAERSLTHTPLFQVTFSLEQAAPARGGLLLGGVALGPFGGGESTAKFDLRLTMSDDGGGLGAVIGYRTALFEAATVARMASHLETVLAAMALYPERRAAEVSLLRGAERAQVLAEWNDTAAEIPHAAVHELFAGHAAAAPEAVAVVLGEDVLTYAELDRRANRLARYLLGCGVGAEERVAVCMDRSVEMAVGVLGVLKASAVYVPLDPSHPLERLRDVIADAGVRRVLTLAGSGAHLPREVERVRLDEPETVAAVAAMPSDSPGVAVDPEQLAYVIYTSGSTGRPKGVAVPHRAVVRLVRNTDYLPFGPDERIAQISNVAFDAATFELWGALLNGGCVVVIGREVSLAPAEFVAELRARRVTALFLTTALFNRITYDVPGAFSTLRHVLFGGELVDPEAVRRVLETGGPERLLHVYGPTETTTYASWHRVRPEDTEATTVPIGGPLGNTRLYVLDARREPVPVGIPGELFIGGAGVARGYLGRPELTGEKFVPDAFGPEAGARLYRTGDRVRWTAAGVIEFLGRIDHQVKIRGFRIEPGEVEAALLEQEGVSEALVVVREDVPGQKRLVAYLVCGEGPGATVAGLRADLRRRLPAYMVPGAFVMLERLPLNANGKVDRRALPAPEREEGAGYAPPRMPAEEVLAGIWAEVLGVERVGVEDSFFDLGGHSLLATQVVSRARQAFGVELPLRALFEAPTVAELVGRIEELRSAGTSLAPALEWVSREALLPLSFAQQRLWLVDQLEPGSAAYNMPYALRLRGRLHLGALRASLDALVRRHETLRTTFAERGGEPVQVIHLPSPVPLPVVDLGGVRGADEEAGRLAGEEALRPFDLARGPLLRSTLLRLAGADHVLCFTLHHVVSDGWSMDVLMREVSLLYAAARRGEAPRLAELPIQYGDYAVWQRAWMNGQVLEEQLSYWKGRLSGAPPLLELPTDRPRTPGQSPRAGGHRFALSPALSQGLRALSRREGTTLFMTLLAGWQTLLGRWAGEEDVVVGSPIAGRTRQETEGLIGFFVNMLALRGKLGGDPTWSELLGRVREEALGAYAHQDLPFERLVEELGVERSLTHTPVFQATLSVDRPGGREQRPEFGELELEPFGAGDGRVHFDLDLAMLDGGEILAGALSFRAALFEATTAARMAAHLEVVLEAMTAEPQRRLSELSLLRGAERVQVLEDWNATEVEAPRGCIHELFAAQAFSTPASDAVRFAGEVLTYAELEVEANRIAHGLRRRGVRPEVRVAICMERGLEMMLGILGVLKAGGAYVPLDPAYPAGRIASTLRDSGAVLLLTQAPLVERFSPSGVPVLALEILRAEVATESPEVPESGVSPENLAYVIYTSGSTGTPKGVAVPHGAVVNYAADMAWRIGLRADDRVLQFASLGFDVVVEELFPAWLSGAAVVLSREDLSAPETLLHVVAREGVTVFELPTAYWHEWVRELAEQRWRVPESVRFVMVGGERVSAERLRDWAEQRVPLVHVYGLTETACTSTTLRLEAGEDGSGWSNLPVGRPTGNVRLYVLDPAGQPTPFGNPGELFIGGEGVGRGYLGRPELTGERFVPDPFSTRPGRRLYRTGDRVTWLSTGELEFLGRIDHQVKIRGFRIEPGEVEAALLEQEGVSEALVVVREDVPGQKRLVAYLVCGEGSGATAAGLRADLAGRLPAYMVPGAFVVLERLPLNANGKVDRCALPAPEREAGEEYAPPRTPTEEVLAGIWAEVLHLERVGVEASFFELGGHSLLATQVVSRVRRSFGVELPLRALFEAPRMAELAGRIEELRSAGAEVVGPIERTPREGPLSLSFAQQRLWFIDQLEPGSAVYNVPFALRLRGRFDPAVLERAVTEIVRRHETLRTVFAVVDGEPVQVIREAAPVALPLTDLRSLPAESREAEVFRLAREEAVRPFDLAAGPLLRVSAVRLDAAEWGLLFTLHHIVSDGWSIGVLIREVSALYDALAEGRESALPELAVQYADYAAWQRGWLAGEKLEAELGYWRDRLAGTPPLLELPTDYPRSQARDSRGGSVRVGLSAEVSRGLRALSRREGATAFMTLLAAWQLLLSRYAGQEDVSVGTPIAGRTRLETEPLIGFFVNTLVLRTDLSGEPTFRELLARVRETTLGAYQHQEIPFERLVEELAPERSLAHTPLFQVMFVLQNNERGELRMGALEMEPLSGGDAEIAKFDLMLALAEDERGFSGSLSFRSDLWERATLERMSGHFACLTEAVVTDPARPVTGVAFLGRQERAQVVERWNATAAPFADDLCVHQLFEAQADRIPAALAVVYAGGTLTYAQLDARANPLARFLRGRGVGPDTCVGLCLERGPEMMVALLGILKAGAAYVPLDPRYPAERLAYMLESSAAPVLLTQESLAAQLPQSGAEVVRVDADRERIGAESAERVDGGGAWPDSLAYVIYTSGSMGWPKGVAMPHRPLVNLLAWQMRDWRASAPAVTLQFTTISFDVSFQEIFSAWSTGGSVVLIGEETRYDPAAILETMEREGVERLFMPAVALQNLAEVADAQGRAPTALREVVTAGEQLRVSAPLRRWMGALEAPLYNHYGPSETHVVTALALTGDPVEWPLLPGIGVPIANTRCFVLDGRGEPAPVGVPGELYLGGVSLARGYLGRPDLTAERFLPDPFLQTSGGRLYRTGDRARWLSDGTLEFLGRVDEQVKVRGFRVEPGEVEAALERHPGVREAVVVVREDAPGEKRLVGYVVPADGAEASSAELRAHLKASLPEYMVPGAFVVLERLPLTPSGKVARRTLPAPERLSAEDFVAPRTPAEEVLAGIWGDVLRVERVGAEDDFFELGGHSLVATRVVSRVRQAFGVELPLRALFEAPTVAGLAGRIGLLQAGGGGMQAPLV
ncbi:MAG: amino acid adenylation domain-containing protein, partial [Longimicrobiaceae bacterium]